LVPLLRSLCEKARFTTPASNIEGNLLSSLLEKRSDGKFFGPAIGAQTLLILFKGRNYFFCYWIEKNKKIPAQLWCKSRSGT